MQDKFFHVRASFTQPVPSDWRDQLVTLLGNRPRRLSTWCELGLFGALTCLQPHFLTTGKSALSSDIMIKLITYRGSMVASKKAIAQMGDGLPMPFTFMQTQTGQLFNALGSALGWHGDGVTTAASNTHIGEVALLASLKCSSLLASVDDVPAALSAWIWLEPIGALDELVELEWLALDSLFAIKPSAQWIKLDQQQRLFQAE